jgi:uncharacterized membrane protein
MRRPASQQKRSSIAPALSETQKVLESLHVGESWKKRLEPRTRGCCFMLNASPYFKYSVALAIILNAFFIAAQAQYAMDNETEKQPLEYNLAENFFCFFFATELLIRLAQERAEFFFESMWRWNLFDSLLVIMALWQLILEVIGNLAGETGSGEGGGNLTFIRVLRVLKMARVIRIVRALHFFDHLRIYLEGIFGCMMALMWLFVLLLVILFIFSIAFVQATTNYLINNPETPSNAKIRDTLKDRFQSVTTGILSLFALMAGGEDWGVVEGHLAEVGLVHRLLFDGFLFFTVFGVLNIVTGLFVTEAAMSSTAQLALREDEKRKLKQKYQGEIREIMIAGDSDGDGSVSMVEFEEIIKDELVVDYFQKLNLSEEDVRRLLALLETDESDVDIEFFVDGCLQLKDGATSTDLAMLVFEQRRLVLEFQTFRSKVERRFRL